MTDIDLTIRLDDNNYTVETGGTVEGEVEVAADEHVESSELSFPPAGRPTTSGEWG